MVKLCFSRISFNMFFDSLFALLVLNNVRCWVLHGFMMSGESNHKI